MTMKIFAILFVSSFIFCNILIAEEGGGKMKITSPAFENNTYIPKKYSGEAEDVNPPLNIADVPRGAKSLVLIMDDPDAPRGTWLHWAVFNIPATTLQIAENSVPGKQGATSSGHNNYGGPYPPSGTHRYFFKLYALDTMLNMSDGISRKELENAMQGHILDKAELIGLYKMSK